MCDIRALEHNTLKVPYQVLNKRFRVCQKTVDREISHCEHELRRVEQILANEPVNSTNLRGAVEALITRLNGLRSKGGTALREEIEAGKVIKDRLDLLRVPLSVTCTPAQLEAWRKLRVDRLIVEYLLRVGYHSTAEQLATRSGAPFMCNLDVFLTGKEVEEALLNKETARALEWCQENKSKLRRLKSPLELRIREQEFIELIRVRDFSGAVEYARKYFSGQDIERWESELLKMIGLLALGPDTTLGQFGDLMSPDRWTDLIILFRTENYRLHQLAGQSVFSATLQSGLSAMKTPQCTHNVNESRHCPTCKPSVARLAQPLPHAHVSHSRLVCALTGEPLNENNPPMSLPNGMVYGTDALNIIALNNNGMIVCPRTGHSYNKDQVSRIYVM